MTSQLAGLFLFVLFFLCACGSDPVADKKKDVRTHWKDYFLPGMENKGKYSKMGTDSMVVTFENLSEYKIDSAVLLFQNQGLLVHHYDTVKVSSVPPKGKFSMQAPEHKLGWTRTIQVIGIYSKALEFCYTCTANTPDKKGDAYFKKW